MARIETVSVTALESFTFGGRQVLKDEVLQVLPVEALSLTFRHQAKFSKPINRYRSSALDAATEVEYVKPKRQYRRRDMQAEDS